ncbi:probable ATP-dependent RNA helicase ddx5 [Olea europaea subsp. europaea]|nr:probable ATP-dependent RNA helicase ddx5 [Olea europaea subsp. europaea]
MKQDNAVDLGKEMVQMSNEDGPNQYEKKHGFENNIECPSKFLIMCLNSVQNALCHSGTINGEDKPLFANAWGIKFWNCYSNGKNLLETSGAYSTIQQISWIASTAADTIARKEKEGVSFTGPFLLFLVPSQEKASQVRQVCKPLKAIGIHTVSLHPGASIEHQINGLKSCEPEFLISTPQRLLELISLKAVDISGVSLLVIDGLEAPCEGGYFDTIKSIRYHISDDARTVVFSDCMNNSSVSVVQKLLAGPVCRSSISTFMNGQSACIMSTNMSKE